MLMLIPFLLQVVAAAPSPAAPRESPGLTQDLPMAEQIPAHVEISEILCKNKNKRREYNVTIENSEGTGLASLWNDYCDRDTDVCAVDAEGDREQGLAGGYDSFFINGYTIEHHGAMFGACKFEGKEMTVRGPGKKKTVLYAFCKSTPYNCHVDDPVFPGVKNEIILKQDE